MVVALERKEAERLGLERMVLSLLVVVVSWRQDEALTLLIAVFSVCGNACCMCGQCCTMRDSQATDCPRLRRGRKGLSRGVSINIRGCLLNQHDIDSCCQRWWGFFQSGVLLYVIPTTLPINQSLSLLECLERAENLVRQHALTCKRYNVAAEASMPIRESAIPLLHLHMCTGSALLCCSIIQSFMRGSPEIWHTQESNSLYPMNPSPPCERIIYTHTHTLTQT